ncbi:hypothetical protein ACQQ2Q_15455 [Agrobacterium sp. ES01]|uniref:hypothetical protein n=1 Tax=Agrobacterium sp. ES01 TaxID=3420714 RepID=UPI003D0E9EE9
MTMQEFRDNSSAVGLCRDADIPLIDGMRFFSARRAQLDRRVCRARISVSAMRRLLWSDLLPDHYWKMIYIDGDTQIVCDIIPLDRLNIPQGKMLAAPVYISIARRCAYQLRSFGDRIASAFSSLRGNANRIELQRVLKDRNLDETLFGPSNAAPSALMPFRGSGIMAHSG